MPYLNFEFRWGSNSKYKLPEALCHSTTFRSIQARPENVKYKKPYAIARFSGSLILLRFVQVATWTHNLQEAICRRLIFTNFQVHPSLAFIILKGPPWRCTWKGGPHGRQFSIIVMPCLQPRRHEIKTCNWKQTEGHAPAKGLDPDHLPNQRRRSIAITALRWHLMEAFSVAVWRH